MDSLTEIFDRQSELMKKLGVKRDLSESNVKDIIACAQVELSEAMAPLLNATKPWKPQAVRWEEVREELVDVLFFLVEAYIVLGMTPSDVLVDYVAKWTKNNQR